MADADLPDSALLDDDSSSGESVGDRGTREQTNVARDDESDTIETAGKTLDDPETQRAEDDAAEMPTSTPTQSPPREPDADAFQRETHFVQLLVQQHNERADEFNNRVVRCRDDVEALSDQLDQLDAAEQIDQPPTPCPRNKFYDHQRYHYQWFDADHDSVQTTKPSERCTGGLCTVGSGSAAEDNLWQKKTEIWLRWDEARQLLRRLASEYHGVARGLESTHSQVDEHHRETNRVAPDGSEPITKPSLTELLDPGTFDLADHPQPQRVKDATAAKPDAPPADVGKVIAAIRDGQLPDSLIVPHADGTYRIKGQENLVYHGFHQLLSDQHLHNRDVWTEVVRRFPEQMKYVPDSVLVDPEFLVWISEQPVDLLERVLPTASSFVRDNADVMLAAMRRSANSIRYASDRLRDDVPFARTALEYVDEDLQHAEINRREVWDVLTAVLDRLRMSPKDDEEAMRTATLIDGRAFEYASDRLKDDRAFVKEIVDRAQQHLTPEQAAEAMIWVARHMGTRLRDDEELALQITKATYGQGVMECWSERLMSSTDFALKALPYGIFRRKMLGQFSESVRDSEEVGLLALQGDGSAMSSLSERLRNHKPFVRRALDLAVDDQSKHNLSDLMGDLYGESDSSGKDLDHELDAADRLIINVGDLPVTVRGEQDIVLQAVASGSSLKGTSSKLLSDPDFVMQAIVQFGRHALHQQIRGRFGDRIVSHLPDRMRDNSDVMVGTIARQGAAARQASARLKNDPKFGIEALKVSENPRSTIQYLAKWLRDDDQFMMQLAEFNPELAVLFASPRLRNDIRFAETVLKNSPNPDEMRLRLSGAFKQKSSGDSLLLTPADVGKFLSVALVVLGTVFVAVIGYQAIGPGFLIALPVVFIVAVGFAMSILRRGPAKQHEPLSDSSKPAAMADRRSNDLRSTPEPEAGDEVSYNSRGQIMPDKRSSRRYLDDRQTG